MVERFPRRGPAVLLAAVTAQLCIANGFQQACALCRHWSTPSLTNDALHAAGMGMATAAASQSSNKKKKGSNRRKNNSASNAATPQPFDVNASLLRLEKKYARLERQASKQLLAMADEEEEGSIWDSTDKFEDSRSDDSVFFEYAIAVKTKDNLDWVPVAKLCLYGASNVLQDAATAWMPAAVSLYCRELAWAAQLGSRRLSKREQMQYAYERVESFYRYVLDPLLEENMDALTMSDARVILNIPNDATHTVIKQRYRQLSMELHPDRAIGTSLSEQDREQRTQQFALVKRAYERLSTWTSSSATGSSWYAGLGGKERTDFVPLSKLQPRGDAQALLERQGITAGVAGLEPDLVQSFVARAAAGSSDSPRLGQVRL